MKNRYIPSGIMLTAGLICSIISIVNHWDVLYSLIVLILVLLIFYCFGAIAERIIRKMQEDNLTERLTEKKRLEKERLEQERLDSELPIDEQQTEGDSDGLERV